MQKTLGKTEEKRAGGERDPILERRNLGDSRDGVKKVKGSKKKTKKKKILPAVLEGGNVKKDLKGEAG